MLKNAHFDHIFSDLLKNNSLWGYMYFTKITFSWVFNINYKKMWYMMLYPPPRVFFVLILIEPFKYTFYGFFWLIIGCAYNTVASVVLL